MKSAFDTPLDIREIAQEYSPSLAGKVPGFIYRKLSRILCLDKLNDFEMKHDDDTVEQFLDSTIEYLGLTYTLENGHYLGECLPENPIFVSNHPFGGPESVVLMKEIMKYYPDLMVVTRKYMTIFRPLRTVFVDVKSGRPLLDIFRNKKPVLIFPAGLCSKEFTRKRYLLDLEWTDGFIRMAQHYRTPVVPIYVSGRNQEKFYKVTRRRKALGIKVAIEALYLPEALFMHNGIPFTVRVGKPIPYEVFDTRIKSQEWADRLRQYIYILRDDIDAVFDPDLEATLIKDFWAK